MGKVFRILLGVMFIVLFISCNSTKDRQIVSLEKKLMEDSLKYNSMIEMLRDSLVIAKKSGSSGYDYTNEFFSYHYEVVQAMGKLFSRQPLSLPGVGLIPMFTVVEDYALESQCYFFYHEHCQFDPAYSLDDFYSKIEQLCRKSTLKMECDEGCGNMMNESNIDGWYSDEKNPNSFIYFVHLSEHSVVKQIEFEKGSSEFDCFTHDLH